MLQKDSIWHIEVLQGACKMDVLPAERRSSPRLLAETHQLHPAHRVRAHGGGFPRQNSCTLCSPEIPGAAVHPPRSTRRTTLNRAARRAEGCSILPRLPPQRPAIPSCSSGWNQSISRFYSRTGGLAEMPTPRAQMFLNLGRCEGKGELRRGHGCLAKAQEGEGLCTRRTPSTAEQSHSSYGGS